MEKLLLWVTNRLVATDTLKKEMKRSRRFWTIICDNYLLSCSCLCNFRSLSLSNFLSKGTNDLDFFIFTG